MIHFNKNNPISQGKFIPLEYVLNNGMTVEVKHDCPVWLAQQAAQNQAAPQYAAQPQYPAPGQYPAAAQNPAPVATAPPPPPPAGGASPTQLVLEEIRRQYPLLENLPVIAEAIKEMVNLLKALHPELAEEQNQPSLLNVPPVTTQAPEGEAAQQEEQGELS